MKPRLLDLFAGAGGCAVGYARAGFDVTCVDIAPHPDNPFPLIVGDAMSVLSAPAVLSAFDVVHASPPCPRYSTVTPAATRDAHPDLIEPVLTALTAWGGAWVVENVPGAPLPNAITLCGAAFGLGATCRDGRRRALRRHRKFASNVWLMTPGCACSGPVVGVYGDGGGGQSTRPSGGGGYKAYPEEAREAMGIDWMRRDDLADAIPPAYTEFVGEQLLAHIGAEAAA